MKKLLLLLLVISATYQDIFSFEVQQAYKKIRNTLLGYPPSYFGTENLSLKHEEFVRSLIKRLGIEKEIIIKKMNLNGFNKFGWANAFAYQVIGYKDHIFISESFFKQLTEGEQIFLIGHELMHIKKDHIRIQTISQRVGFPLALIAAGYLSHYHIPSRILRPSLICGLLIGNVYLQQALSRACEREADKESAQQLNSAEGGISFFKRLQTLEPPQRLLTYYIRALFGTHPNNQERITYLEKIMHNHTITNSQQSERDTSS
jgi:Zn-dependent protease with chaperone function